MKKYKRLLFLDDSSGKFLYLIERWKLYGFNYVGIKNSDKSFAMFENDILEIITFDLDLTFRVNFPINRRLHYLIGITLDYFISIVDGDL